MTTRPDISEDALAFLRRRVRAMLGGVRVDAKLIAENIAFGAAVLGSGHIELVDDNGWWFVASEFNWLAASKAHAEPTVREAAAVPGAVAHWPSSRNLRHGLRGAGVLPHGQCRDVASR